MDGNYIIAIRKKDGKIVTIADLTPAEQGLNCGCVCYGCRTDLVAKMGNIRRWHFAHNGSGCDAKKVNITGLYQLVFEYLSEKRPLLLPTVGLCYNLTYDGNPDHAKTPLPITENTAAKRIHVCSPYPQDSKGEPLIKEPKPWKLTSPELSMCSEGYPDAIIDTAESRELALCIIPPKMIHKNVIATRYKELPTIILDLSEVNIQELTHQYLYDSIMQDPSFFYWIHYPKAQEHYQEIYAKSFEACKNMLFGL